MYQEGIPCQIPLGAQSEEDKLNGLLAEYAKLLERLDQTVEAGKLDPRDRYTVVQMLKKVTDVLAARYKNVRKGVDEVMGGRILDYPGRKELHAAEARGKLKAFADLVRKGFLSLKDASSELNMTEAEFNNQMAALG